MKINSYRIKYSIYAFIYYNSWFLYIQYGNSSRNRERQRERQREREGERERQREREREGGRETMSLMLRVNASLLMLLECILRVLIEVLIVFPSMLIGSVSNLVMAFAGARRKKFKSVFLTGASSGLGAALARRLSGPGVRLVLTARRVDKLEETAQECRALGSEVVVHALDVTDRDAVRKVIEECDAESPIDLLIANAGVSLGMLNLQPNRLDMLKALLPLTDVNVCGVYACVAAIAPKMCERRRGQVAIMSSIAGNGPMWDEPAYSASKVAVRYFGEALRPLLRNYNVGVSVITPGCVNSGDMTNTLAKGRPDKLPLVVSEKDAIRITVDGLERNLGVIAFPFIPYFLTYAIGILPVSLRSWVRNRHGFRASRRIAELRVWRFPVSLPLSRALSISRANNILASALLTELNCSFGARGHWNPSTTRQGYSLLNTKHMARRMIGEPAGFEQSRKR